jgi:hypothetical protein
MHPPLSYPWLGESLHFVPRFGHWEMYVMFFKFPQKSSVTLVVHGGIVAEVFPSPEFPLTLDEQVAEYSHACINVIPCHTWFICSDTCHAFPIHRTFHTIITANFT